MIHSMKDLPAPTFIDPSGTSTFKRCKARYFFKQILGIEPVDATRIAADYGTDMHAALPFCYQEKDVERAAREFEKGWRARAYGEGDEKRNCLRARASLKNFLETHSASTCPYEILHLPIKVPTTKLISQNEIPFVIDIGGCLPFAGRIDAAIRWKSTKQVFALDYKTSSEVSGRYFDSFEAAPQTFGYTMALKHLIEEPVMGMVLEAIRVSEKNIENQVHPIFVSEFSIREFVEFVNGISERIVECCKKGEWEKNWAGCNSYSSFGQPSRSCEFRDICLAPDWESMARTYRKVEPFKPFEMVGE